VIQLIARGRFEQIQHIAAAHILLVAHIPDNGSGIGMKVVT